MANTKKVLCVDDDAGMLAAFRAFCHFPQGPEDEWTLQTVQTPQEALDALTASGPYAVIVSDLHMPGMDGIRFLRQAQEVAPDSVRIMLTGFADLKAAVEAVNEAFVFRFQTKPCSQSLFLKTIRAGIKQYQLITAEKELLEKTLAGAIKSLTEVLALASPAAFGRTLRIQRLALQLGAELRLKSAWQLEVASLLCQIGCIAIPKDVLRKLHLGARLSDEEADTVADYPLVGCNLIAGIPRLEEVATIIAQQDIRFDNGSGTVIPLEASILKVALDFDSLASRLDSRAQAFESLRQRTGWYDPAVVKALAAVLAKETPWEMQELSLRRLAAMLDEAERGLCRRERRVPCIVGDFPRMILAEDLLADNDSLLLSKGNELTPAMLEKLQLYSRSIGVREPIRVLVPATARQ